MTATPTAGHCTLGSSQHTNALDTPWPASAAATGWSSTQPSGNCAQVTNATSRDVTTSLLAFDARQHGRQLVERCNRAVARVRDEQVRVHILLVGPGERVGDVDRPAAESEDRRHVRARRVAHHHEARRVEVVAAQQPLVGPLVLAGDDLDALEPVSEPGARELALLVEQ